MPHLSLLYGHLSDEEKKKAVEMVEDFDNSLVGLKFQVVELGLYKVGIDDETLKSWEKVATCDLTRLHSIA